MIHHGNGKIWNKRHLFTKSYCVLSCIRKKKYVHNFANCSQKFLYLSLPVKNTVVVIPIQIITYWKDEVRNCTYNTMYVQYTFFQPCKKMGS